MVVENSPDSHKPVDNSLKIKDLLKTAAERGKRDDNKTQPKTRIKTPDSLRQGASQAAGAAPTLRIRQQVQNALAAAREGLARADHELRVRRLASTGRRRQCYLPSCTGR